MKTTSTWFQRIVLPGFAFKAVVIGGGYATGRELATYFLPSGPWGGLWGMLLAMAVWSLVCTVTFLFALQTQSTDYRAFFRNLLGRGWPIFEVLYFLAMIVILAVFAAAAGAIGQSLLGWPPLAGSLVLMAGIALVATWGNEAVERLFKYVTVFLYGTYAVFVLLAMSRFGDRMLGAFALHPPTTGWAMGGLTYAGYNIIGAVAILPVTRHMIGRRDAIAAGLLAGPLAMIPAILFFLCMVAYYPEISGQTLPSDFLLQRLDLPAFRVVFQLMIFAALLESGTGGVHAINERIAHAYQARGDRTFSKLARLAVTLVVLTGSVFVADRFGLVELIASGYTWLSYAFLAIFVLPLLTYGVVLLLRRRHDPIIAQTSPEAA
ncbi:MAG: YkvI family membrane protein [Phenylobacterium sp.]